MSMMVLFGYGIYLLWKDVKDFFNRKFRHKAEEVKVPAFE